MKKFLIPLIFGVFISFNGAEIEADCNEEENVLLMESDCQEASSSENLSPTMASCENEIPVESKKRLPFPRPKRIYISHIEGTNDGVAYTTNYSTLGIVFAPTYQQGAWLPMVDFRVHRFDSDDIYAFNGGVIARYIPGPFSTSCNCLGFNVYYDFRQGFIGYYQQIGSGVEVIGHRWDLRGNIYFPVGARKHSKTCVYDDYVGDYVITNSQYESVSFAFNAEVGCYLINTCSFFLYGAIGPYYIAGRECCDSTRGGRARIRPQYEDYFALDLSVSYDALFKTVWQAEVSISLPLYQIFSKGKSSETPCRISDRRIYQPVERFEVMPLGIRDCWTQNY